MKKKYIQFGLPSILILFLIYFIYGYYKTENFDPSVSDLTVNINDSTYQAIYVDKSLGITKMVSAKFEVSEVNTQRRTNIKGIKLRTIKLSGIGGIGIHYAAYHGNRIVIYFSPNGKQDCFEVDILDESDISIDGINEIQVIGRNWLDFVKSTVFKNHCSDYFAEKGIHNSSQKMDPDCLNFLLAEEEGRICNVNCVHE